MTERGSLLDLITDTGALVGCVMVLTFIGHPNMPVGALMAMSYVLMGIFVLVFLIRFFEHLGFGILAVIEKLPIRRKAKLQRRAEEAQRKLILAQQKLLESQKASGTKQTTKEQPQSSNHDKQDGVSGSSGGRVSSPDDVVKQF